MCFVFLSVGSTHTVIDVYSTPPKAPQPPPPHTPFHALHSAILCTFSFLFCSFLSQLNSMTFKCPCYEKVTADITIKTPIIYRPTSSYLPLAKSLPTSSTMPFEGSGGIEKSHSCKWAKWIQWHALPHIQQSTQQRNKGYYPNLHGWDFSIPPSPLWERYNVG